MGHAFNRHNGVQVGPATIQHSHDDQLAGQSLNERIAALEIMLAKILAAILQEHHPVNYVVNISSSCPFILDFKGYKHIFVYSTSSQNMTIDTVGTFTLPAATWTNLSFEQGTRIVNDSSTMATLFVKCTNEVIP